MKVLGRRRRKSKKLRIRHGYFRPENIRWDERIAEAWLCRRNHWNKDIFTGRVPVTPRGTSGAYRLLHPLPLLLQWKPRPAALRISGWHRFGNAVTQLGNAFYLAEQWDIRQIEFAKPHPFFRGEHIASIALSWSMENKPAIVPTLEGLFFQVEAFRYSMPSRRHTDVFPKYVRPLIAPEIGVPDPRVADDDLVLHFRAGDIFRPNKPHPQYAQPPLSYYLAAVEREQPVRVWIVYEDRSNPCVDAAEAALRERGIPVLTQSATLAEDIRVLMSARTLVAGRGSFVHMIAHLSERLRKIYFFERDSGKSVGSNGVEVVLGTDAGGAFKAALLNGNWTGSPEQRALLLSYPAEQLRFQPAPRG